MLNSTKHVCVIGGGSSGKRKYMKTIYMLMLSFIYLFIVIGLVVMKELRSVGHTFHCFELLPNVGGVVILIYY